MTVPLGASCRFLGLLKDPDDTVSVPWPEHRCYSTGRPATVAKGTQGMFCLSSGHDSCPRFILARNLQSIPEDDVPRQLTTRSAAPKPAPKAARQVEDAEERRPFAERFGPLLTLALRAGMVAAVVTLIVSLDFAFFRSLRSDTVRGEGASTPGPLITTYTLTAPTPTAAIPPTPGVILPFLTVAPSFPTSAPVAQTYPTFAVPTSTPVRPAPTIAPPEPTMAGPATVSLQPSEGPAGTQVTILGVYWTPNSEILLRWGTQPNENGMTELGNARTSASGAFTGTTRIPAVGQGTIYIGIRQGNRAAYLPFRVTS